MTSFECFQFDALGSDASEVYRVLGDFYALRSQVGKPVPGVATVPAGAAAPVDPTARRTHELQAKEDLSRAYFYLARSIEKGPNNTVALNDLGYLDLVVANDAAKAAPRFKLSCELDPRQQRAYYNLGCIALVDRPREAEELLSRALGNQHWQGKQAPRNRASILYNLACARAKQAPARPEPEKSNLLRAALTDLEAAFDDPDRDREVLKRSFFPEGGGVDSDLTAFAGFQPLQDRFRALETQVRSS